MLLANCHEVEIAKCGGQNMTAAGRAGNSDGKDWPKELDNENY